jgi:hypothetical protein
MHVHDAVGKSAHDAVSKSTIYHAHHEGTQFISQQLHVENNMANGDITKKNTVC